MSDLFPSQAQIARAIKGAEKAGLQVSGFRIEPNGALSVFACEAPSLARLAPPGEDQDSNDFD